MAGKGRQAISFVRPEDYGSCLMPQGPSTKARTSHIPLWETITGGSGQGVAITVTIRATITVAQRREEREAVGVSSFHGAPGNAKAVPIC